MAVKQAAIVQKKKKKLWYQIVSPKILGNVVLGESIVYSKEELKNKSLKLNLSTIVNDMRKQHLDIYFKVIEVVDNKGITEISGVSLVQSYIKRLVRRGRNKVDDSFLAKSKDQKTIRIKPLLITNYKTNRSVTSKLRLETREIIRKILMKTDAVDFFHMIITGKIQKEIRDKVNKIYPLKHIEIRIAKFDKETSSLKETSNKLSSKDSSEEEVQEDIDESTDIDETTETDSDGHENYEDSEDNNTDEVSDMRDSNNEKYQENLNYEDTDELEQENITSNNELKKSKVKKNSKKNK